MLDLQTLGNGKDIFIRSGSGWKLEPQLQADRNLHYTNDRGIGAKIRN